VLLGTGVWGNNADAINGVSLDVNAAERYFKAHPMLQHQHGREFGIDFVALLQTQGWLPPFVVERQNQTKEV